jgi:hypothetical protein
MKINELPVCQNTTEEPEFNQETWVCKESGQEMNFDGQEWVCEKCSKGNTKAGKQREVHKPRPPTESEIAAGKKKAREEFEKQKREKEADKVDQEKRERQNYQRPRGG